MPSRLLAVSAALHRLEKGIQTDTFIIYIWKIYSLKDTPCKREVNDKELISSNIINIKFHNISQAPLKLFVAYGKHSSLWLNTSIF